MINTFEYIKEKQKYWAERKGIELIGSKKEFMLGDGGELGDGTNPGKMQALHSSSALGVNVFEYWKANERYSILAKALHIPSNGIEDIHFEEKYKIFNDANKSPNIDVVIHYKNSYLVGIECKFTEPFQPIRGEKGLKEKYINNFEYWHAFPYLKKLAVEISPNDEKNIFIHCAQLIKHTLGLFSVQKDKDKFRLLYIYQPAFFEDNERYLKEMTILQDAMRQDGIIFQFLSWQELLINLKSYIEEDDKAYMDYLVERYL
jgi:hypothetical protein